MGDWCTAVTLFDFVRRLTSAALEIDSSVVGRNFPSFRFVIFFVSKFKTGKFSKR